MKKLTSLLCLSLALCTALAMMTDAPSATNDAIAAGATRSYGPQVASGCVPRPFPACYYNTPGSLYWCPLTPDEIARITCTGPYAN
jgi:hypothetical protein